MAIIDGIISHWKLDETEAGAVVDATGNHNATNDNGVINQDGKIGRAYSFDNSDTQHVEVTDHADFNFNDTSFTFGGWFYGTEMDREGRGMGKYSATSIYQLRLGQSDWHINFYLRDSEGHNTGWVETSDHYAENTWYNIYVVVDQVGETAKLYINGVEKVSVSISTLENISPVANLYIGDYRDGVSGMIGRIDEVSIWGKALTQPEITALWNGGDGLAYPFEEAEEGTNTKIQIGGAWKEIAAAQIQIGGAWKAVEGMQVVIDDGGATWKTVF